MGISATMRRGQVTDKPELMSNSAASCLHPQQLTVLSTCINSTPCLHELYAYQHKMGAISSANDCDM